MSSDRILQKADAALREAVNILHEKGSTGSGELSHDQALELLDVQQNLRKEHGDLKQAIRSGSTGWFSRSSSTSATVHLEQCQGLVQRIQETIEGNMTANIRSGRAPSTTSGRNISSAPQPAIALSPLTAALKETIEGNMTANIRSGRAPSNDLWQNISSAPQPATAPQHTQAAPKVSQTSAASGVYCQFNRLQSCSYADSTADTAIPNYYTPIGIQLPFDPETFARLTSGSRRGEVKVYSNCITGQGSNSVGTTMNVGGYGNTGSAITYKRHQ
ncbi:hypothetical protein BU15DRAFT_77046 [Melanogaster broomeanus]|nr:hypothetical protein BU15DRAFT_77046 [Melanogaster broomeanus]